MQTGPARKKAKMQTGPARKLDTNPIIYKTTSTPWTELTCWDDHAHGVWGMSYKSKLPTAELLISQSHGK